jgi:hypothetical protein
MDIRVFGLICIMWPLKREKGKKKKKKKKKGYLGVLLPVGVDVF